MDFITLAAKVSPTFWGIVVGSLFTIIGVVLTNASNIKRLRIQQDYEREMKNKERDLSLRKEVYLAAMEAISAGMVSIGRFSELDASPYELMRSYTAKSPALSKVTIVGQNDTIKAVVEFNQELTRTFIRLSTKRSKLDPLQKRITTLEGQISQLSDERDRLASRLENFDDSQASKNETIQQHSERIEARWNELQETLSGLHERFYRLLMDLVDLCIQEISKLDILLVKVISLMRSELDLPFDEARYLDLIKSNHQKLAEFMQSHHLEEASEGDAI